MRSSTESLMAYPKISQNLPKSENYVSEVFCLSEENLEVVLGAFDLPEGREDVFFQILELEILVIKLLEDFAQFDLIRVVYTIKVK